MEPSDGWRIRDKTQRSRSQWIRRLRWYRRAVRAYPDAVAYVIGPSGRMNARIASAWTIRATDGCGCLLSYESVAVDCRKEYRPIEGYGAECVPPDLDI
ncbi:hypothetical protein Bca52824_003519 [Brassica carinata]|uniref:Uncharacterized protein n=1 Tax=Brassica carinata TaxID=52824 RepID=A0A8X7WJY6_BRACI|nr:hypothetical protein Bca52824_003519 [Brassica carinata]